jgi:(p)ppGpp synthase/HD superfamily hydrolase
MIVALLHDVVEDNEAWTLERLTAVGFSQEVVTAVDALSRRSDESYEAFIERIRPNPLAVRVKLADLRDNMNPLRLEKLTERDLERLVKYHQAWQVLNGR